MTPKEFESLMYIITAHTVEKIAERTGKSENEAMLEFLRSRVYAVLENEQSKAWHFSTTMIAQLFIDEQNGCLTWPEVA